MYESLPWALRAYLEYVVRSNGAHNLNPPLYGSSRKSRIQLWEHCLLELFAQFCCVQQSFQVGIKSLREWEHGINNLFMIRVPAPESNSNTNMWYSFDYANVHFVSIDTETDYPKAPFNVSDFGDQLGNTSLESILEDDLLITLLSLARTRPCKSWPISHTLGHCWWS